MRASVRRGTRMSAALCILALVAGCEPTASELAANRVAARLAAAEALENQAVWVGTVRGYEGRRNDKIILDYGGKFGNDICAAMPGLRVLKLVRDGATLRQGIPFTSYGWSRSIMFAPCLAELSAIRR